jgi:hypothetical protein
LPDRTVVDAMNRVLAIALTAACWRSSAPAQPSRTEERPPPVSTRPPPPPPLSDNDRFMQELERYADDMCACPDNTCAQQVASDVARWSMELGQGSGTPKLTDDETKRASEIGMRIADCMYKAMSNAMGSAAP